MDNSSRTKDNNRKRKNRKKKKRKETLNARSCAQALRFERLNSLFKLLFCTYAYTYVLIIVIYLINRKNKIIQSNYHRTTKIQYCHVNSFLIVDDFVKLY